MDDRSPSAAQRHREANRAHWSATLDAQNLAESGQPLDLERQVALAETGDVTAALRHLAPLRGARVLDLGGGLGLMAIMMARGGARVVVADLSTERMVRAREHARQLGLESRMEFVACAAEELPFRGAAFARQISKSVLIHTDLPRAAAELARTLAPSGRAAFIEPTTGNPFVNLYRRLAAPRIWAEITAYFDHARLTVLERPFRLAGRDAERESLFLFAFFATPFNFLLPTVALYRLAERALMGMDALLFAVAPALKQGAWFCVVKIKSGRRTSRPTSNR